MVWYIKFLYTVMSYDTVVYQVTVLRLSILL